MGSKKYNSKNQSTFLGENYALIPLLLVLFAVPLVTRLYQFNSKLSQFSWFPNRDVLDVFLYWKSVWLMVLGAVMAIVVAARLSSRRARAEYKKNLWLYFIAGYGLLTLLSTVFSKYRSFGFSGIHEQFESVWVILTYCILTVYACGTIRKENDLHAVRCALAALLAVLGALGISQLVGHDFFESAAGLQLIVPEKLSVYRETLQFNFSGTGTHQVYLTLYNPNYVGMFSSLLLPVSVALLFASKDWKHRLLWCVLSLLLLVCTFGSGSKSFLISFVLSVVVALIFCRRVLLSRWKLLLPAVLVLMLAGAGYFAYAKLNPFRYVKNAMTLEKNNYILEDIRLTENDIVIRYKGEELHAAYLVADGVPYLFCFDNTGTPVQYEIHENGWFFTSNPRFSSIYFRFLSGDEANPLIENVYLWDIKTNIYFVSTNTGYRLYTNAGKVGDVDHPESAVFTNYDSLASGRGYLWSRTIPLLKHSLLLGTGADTFSIVFPQNDVVGKVNNNIYTSTVTKPHNLYLQIGVQHGVLALICFLAVCVLYLVQSFRLYWRDSFTDSTHWFGFGIMIGVIGYLISGLTNDSTITVAPLFWALLGIGFAINRMLRQEAAMQRAGAGQKKQNGRAAAKKAEEAASSRQNDKLTMQAASEKQASKTSMSHTLTAEAALPEQTDKTQSVQAAPPKQTGKSKKHSKRK